MLNLVNPRYSAVYDADAGIVRLEFGGRGDSDPDTVSIAVAPGAVPALINALLKAQVDSRRPRPAGGPAPPGWLVSAAAADAGGCPTRPVPLQGTARQVAWAESIRRNRLASARHRRPDLVDVLAIIRDATWWIASNNTPFDRLNWPTPDQVDPRGGARPDVRRDAPDPADERPRYIEKHRRTRRPVELDPAMVAPPAGDGSTFDEFGDFNP